ncbi:Anthocyanidin 3-O-glucosyltransferase [Bertholletia excelsa]
MKITGCIFYSRIIKSSINQFYGTIFLNGLVLVGFHNFNYPLQPRVGISGSRPPVRNTLVTNHGCHVTILAVTTHNSPSLSKLLHSATRKLLSIVELPLVDISGRADPGAAVVTRLAVMMREALPAIRSALSDPKLRRPRTVFIANLFGTESLQIADELCMPKYLFVPTNTWFAALTSYCHVLDREVSGQYVDQVEPLRLPGCIPVRPGDVIDPMLDRDDQQYREIVRIGIEFSLADGILINTWEDLERATLAALRGDDFAKVPVYPIGPLTKPAEESGSDDELFEWLNEQPVDSVVYVSFGSGGTLSAEQNAELAWGLELSRQRFVWVVRRPVEGRSDASFFKSGGGPKGEPDFLPPEFLTRSRNVGKLVPEWVPQVKILSHPSVGAFLSHCGWNSILESLTNGVPIIAWPLYAEQRMNATFLVEELGVAVKPSTLPTKKVVERGEIEEMVRSVMDSEQGKAMRERVRELKRSAEMAKGEGGSSYQAICDLLKDCQSKLDSNNARLVI